MSAAKVIGMTPTVRPQGDIEVRIHFLDPVGHVTSESFIIDYEEAWHLATNLQSCLHGLADRRMRNAAAGDCKTCGNARMVTTEKHGQPWREHCPACHAAYSQTNPPFPPERDHAE